MSEYGVPPEVLAAAQERAQREGKSLAGQVAKWVEIYADGYDLVLTVSRAQWEESQRHRKLRELGLPPDESALRGAQGGAG